MKRWIILAGILALLAAAMAMKPWLVQVPAVPAAAAGDFDTGRALARLKRILGDERPHPVDTAANDAVRQRLLAELRAIGLTPTVTDDLACNGSKESRTVSCARVRNVLATVGPPSGRHVLLVSHYDSTPVGPGAADDGIGVAVMLEAAALLRDRPLKRSVTFLFNEGEETGLIGARAFLERNPLAARVEAVVNLESRGVNGPAIMFETSRPNGAALAAYSGVDRPAGNSLTTDFYGLIPNSTDVSVFQERPWTILNFAIIGNETRYHSPGDSLAALDPRSVRHMGAQALAVTEKLANGAAAPAGEKLYADVLGAGLVTLPLWLGVLALVALLVACAALAWHRRGGVGRGAAAVLVAMVDAGLTVFLLHSLVGWLRPEGEYWRANPELLSFAIDATALASAATALLWLARPIARDRLRLAYWLVFLILGALLAVAAPGAIIFFLLPPLIALLGFVRRRLERPAQLLASAGLFLSWVPLLHLSQVLLDLDSGWVFAPVSALILLPWLIELKPEMNRAGRGAVTAVLATAALVAWLPASLAPAYSADRKQRMSLEYVWDDSARTARWMVYHDRGALPEPFGRFERGVEVPWSTYPRWAAAAVGPAVPPPLLERIAERRTPEGRLLTLRLRTRGADVVRLRAEPETRLRAVQVTGAPLRLFGKGSAKEDYGWRCHGRACDELVFDLLVGSAAPVEVTLVGTRTGLPPQAGPLLEARRGTAHPQYGADSTYSVARVTL